MSTQARAISVNLRRRSACSLCKAFCKRKLNGFMGFGLGKMVLGANKKSAEEENAEACIRVLEARGATVVAPPPPENGFVGFVSALFG